MALGQLRLSVSSSKHANGFLTVHDVALHNARPNAPDHRVVMYLEQTEAVEASNA